MLRFTSLLTPLRAAVYTFPTLITLPDTTSINNKGTSCEAMVPSSVSEEFTKQRDRDGSKIAACVKRTFTLKYISILKQGLCNEYESC
ncbi:uncharacterized protein G2W53_017833 [Senna tora]|uniref:Uncharacterized protein n=1 Tax=Senna tora TaxID=362788 RepID=A0A834WR60_9FABA|nr:uncharacterized protein G2W53_017833 [Senna tora]